MFQSIYDYFFTSTLGLWELSATVFLVANVYLLGQQKLVNYWFGLAGVLIFGYIFYEYQLYSDMALQWFFYGPLQVIGFFMWKYGGTLGSSDKSQATDSMKVVTLGWSPRWRWVLGIALFSMLLGGLMATYTDASFPYADALTTVMSIAASLLMLKKVLENWYLWIAMDLIAIPIYYAKGLYITSGLYVLFLVLATLGLLAWRKDYLKQLS